MSDTNTNSILSSVVAPGSSPDQALQGTPASGDMTVAPAVSGGIVPNAAAAINPAMGVAPGTDPNAPMPDLGTPNAPLPTHQTRLGAILSAVSDAMRQPINTTSGPTTKGALILNTLANGIAGAGSQRGRQSFGSGAAAGAQKQLEYQFESVQAADSHRKALDEHNRAEQLSDEEKLQYKQNQASYQAYMQDNFGISPDLTFNDDSTSATAALGTLSDRNGGKIPPVVTSQQPDVKGTHGSIAVYSPTQQQMIDNQKGFRELINTQRDVQGLKPIDDATFNSLGFKGQLKAFQDAQQFLSPTPSFSDKEKLPVMIAQRKQQLDAYLAKHTVNGQLDENSAKTAAILKSGVTYLQNTYDQASNTENTNAANAAGKKTQAEQNVLNSPANQQAAANKSAAEEMAKQGVQRAYAKGDYGQLVAQDVTGWKPPNGVFLNENQIQTASAKLANSKEYQAAQDAERSYQMASGAYNDYVAAKGQLPSGAQSMLMLSSHLQTTFGNVKGSRVTKDMIAEHLHARSVSDDGLVAVQKLTSGDQLSPKQWNAFMGLIKQSRGLSWGNAITTAHVMRLPVTADIVPIDIAQKQGDSGQTASAPKQTGNYSSNNPFVAPK